jgi:hypothetical protein
MLDWDKYIKVANRFQYKARREDREDLRQTIILELAKVELKYNGSGRTLSEGGMIRVASYRVMEYWRQVYRHNGVVSLNSVVEDEDGDTIELAETIADDKALDIAEWVNARLWLHRCQPRLVKIAYKKVAGYPLTSAEQAYFNRQRKKAQKELVLV